jgi:hypothetical protein
VVGTIRVDNPVVKRDGVIAMLKLKVDNLSQEIPALKKELNDMKIIKNKIQVIKNKQEKKLKKFKSKTADSLKEMIKTGNKWEEMLVAAEYYASTLNEEHFIDEVDTEQAKPKSGKIDFMKDVTIANDQLGSEEKKRFEETKKIILQCMKKLVSANGSRDRLLSDASKRLRTDTNDESEEAEVKEEDPPVSKHRLSSSPNQ